jgi:tetratricopeptide (TPR) repeat protein
VVRSTLAASRFTGPNLDLKEIAEIAEVDLVVTGTLLRVGDQVRVSTQLLEAPYGTVLWTQSSQIGMIDLFQLQDSLARQIVESISQPLAGRERRSLQRDVPATAKAYEFYLRANQLAQSNQGWELARDLYLQCLEEDAKYAPAWAQLGRIYRVLAKYVEIDSEENRLRAADAFHRALELNPDLSLAHNLYVYLEVEMGRAKDAMVRLLDRAKSRPSEASLLAGLVQACRYCGLLDASVAAAERAQRLDPNLPLSVTYTHWMMGNYEGAMETRDYDLPFIRAYSLSALGRHEEARAIFHEIQRVPHLHARGFGTAMYCILEGDHAGALEYMRSIENSSFRDPEGLYFIARCYAYLGHTESALKLVDRVVTGGFFCDQTMARDPWMDSVRTHPDFVAALRRSEALRRDAVAAYLEHEGDRILGVRPLV